MGSDKQQLDIVGEATFAGKDLFVTLQGDIYKLNSKAARLPNSPIVDYRVFSHKKYFEPFSLTHAVPRLYKSFVGNFMTDHKNQDIVDLIENLFSEWSENEEKVVAIKEKIILPSGSSGTLGLTDDAQLCYFADKASFFPNPDFRFYNNISYFESLNLESMTSDLYRHLLGQFFDDYHKLETGILKLKSLNNRKIPEKIKSRLPEMNGSAVDLTTGSLIIPAESGYLFDSNREIILDANNNVFISVIENSPYLVGRQYNNLDEYFLPVKKQHVPLIISNSELINNTYARSAFDKNEFASLNSMSRKDAQNTFKRIISGSYSYE
ncbi:MAG: hypothetical protein ACQESC_01265 [Nanobdellota archaeon]